MKSVILRNWNVMRILRIAMGVFIISQGVLAEEWFIIIMGSIFSLLAILNVGCCGAGACSTPINHNKKQGEEISFEEIK